MPILAVVQDLHRARTDRNAFQELDQIALFQGCAKQIFRTGVAARVEDYVDLAFTAAAGGRPSPVVLLCPYDVFDEPAPAPSGRKASLGRYPIDRPVADPAAVARAAELLANAERPLIVAGACTCLMPRTSSPGCRSRRPCRSPPPAWARARSTSAIRSRWASPATSWALAAWRAITGR